MIDADAEKSKLLMYVICPAALFAAQRAALMPAVVTPGSVPAVVALPVETVEPLVGVEPPVAGVEPVVAVEPLVGVEPPVVAVEPAVVVEVAVDAAPVVVEAAVLGDAAVVGADLLLLLHAVKTRATAASTDPALIRLFTLIIWWVLDFLLG